MSDLKERRLELTKALEVFKEYENISTIIPNKLKSSRFIDLHEDDLKKFEMPLEMLQNAFDKHIHLYEFLLNELDENCGHTETEEIYKGSGHGHEFYDLVCTKCGKKLDYVRY